MKNSSRKPEQNADERARKEYVKSVGIRVKTLRRRRQWTQEMLAQKAEINDKYVYDIESGKKCMSIWVLIKVSKALGIDASELLEG